MKVKPEWVVLPVGLLTGLVIGPAVVGNDSAVTTLTTGIAAMLVTGLILWLLDPVAADPPGSDDVRDTRLSASDGRCSVSAQRCEGGGEGCRGVMRGPEATLSVVERPWRDGVATDDPDPAGRRRAQSSMSPDSLTRDDTVYLYADDTDRPVRSVAGSGTRERFIASGRSARRRRWPDLRAGRRNRPARPRRTRG